MPKAKFPREPLSCNVISDNKRCGSKGFTYPIAKKRPPIIAMQKSNLKLCYFKGAPSYHLIKSL